MGAETGDYETIMRDQNFEIRTIKKIDQDAGWEKIREIPRLFPDFQ